MARQTSEYTYSPQSRPLSKGGKTLKNAISQLITILSRTHGVNASKIYALLSKPAAMKELIAWITAGSPVGELIQKKKLGVKMEHSKHIRMCRLMLRKDYVSPNQISETFGLGYSEEQLQHLADTLPDAETLALLGEKGFKLLSTLPLPTTSFDILQLSFEAAKVPFDNYSNLKGQDFFDEVIPAAEWIAISLEDMSTSNLSFRKQIESLQPNEYVASFVQTLYAIMVQYCIDEDTICYTHRVRTSCAHESGARVYIGNFTDNGPMINWDTGDFPNTDCLLAKGFELS